MLVTMTNDVIDLHGLNALPEPAAVRLLLTCCASPIWAHEVATRRPYQTTEALLRAADEALAGLSEAELDRAVASHPRIGAPATDPVSAREQAGVADSAGEVRDALAAWNREYEARFGHVYLVCATGRSAGELLDILLARLTNDHRTERAIVRAELAKINRIRLSRMVNARPDAQAVAS